MPTNHVFVDFENVQEIDLSLIGGKDVNFTLLIGPTHKKLDTDLVERLLASSATVQLIRLKSPGRNALDFALAYYAGRASANDPHGYIHVVAEDKGYDPLIEHLTAKGTKAKRHESCATLVFTSNPQAAKAAPETDERLEKAVGHLKKNLTNRPKKKKTLLAHLHNLFSKKLDEKELEALVAKLKSAGHIKINSKDEVTYQNLT